MKHDAVLIYSSLKQSDFGYFLKSVGIPMEEWLVENVGDRFDWIGYTGSGDFLGVTFYDFNDALAFKLAFSDKIEIKLEPHLTMPAGFRMVPRP